jgi:hypothetical protein
MPRRPGKLGAALDGDKMQVTRARPLVDFDALDARIREIASEVAARPEYVTQRNVKAVVGVEGREFLRLARDEAFPSTKDRRLVIARTVDVLEYYELRLRLARSTPAANDANAEAIAFSRVGARRVGA